MLIIEKFSQQVSWLKTYVHVNPDKGDWNPNSVMSIWNCYIGKTEDDTLIKFLCIPSKDFQKAVSLLSSYTEKIWLIIEGDLDLKILEEFLFQTHRNIIPWFINPETSIEYNALLKRALDGIDWEKSLNTKSLSFEWDN